MLKKVTLFSIPIVSVLIVILNFKNVQTYLNIPENGKFLIYFEGLIVLGTIFNYTINFVIPFFAYKRLAKLRWLKINEIIEEHLSFYPKNYGLTVDVLMPRWEYFKSIIPSDYNYVETKFSRMLEVFTIVARSDNSFFPNSLKIAISQAPYGTIFKEKGNTEIFDQAEIGAFNFSKKQKDATKNIIILALCGIKIFENKESGFHPIKLGLLCVQSKSQKSLILVENNEAKELFEQHTNKLEKQIRYLLS